MIKCIVCKNFADVMFISPTGKQRKGYCRNCYGDGQWIREQNLFINWSLEKIDRKRTSRE